MKEIIKNSYGEIIDYSFHPGSYNNNFLFLIGHGLAGNKDNLLITRIAEKVVDEGMSVLRFSFSGNGGSEGKFEECTISKEILDLQAILNSVTKMGWRPIYAGHSLGGTVGALTSVLDSRIQLLISIAGIVETEAFYQKEFIRDISKNGYILKNSNISVTQEFVDDFRQIQSLRLKVMNLKIPWLMIHGTNDEIVPLADSYSLTKDFESSREIIKIEDADHIFSASSLDVMIESVIDWTGGKLQI